MTFSIIHPSIRPHKWREIYDAWIKAAAHPENVEYILVVDEKWGFDSGTTGVLDWSYERDDHGPSFVASNKLYFNSEGFISSVNAGAKAATGDVLIQIADDMWPAERWDRALQSCAYAGEHRAGYVRDGELHGELAIWVNNGDRHIGTRGDIMAMPVISRSRFERLGYLYYPGYQSMYADNDLAEHCQLDAEEGRCTLIVLNGPVFPHKHPANDPSIPMDAAYQWQNRPEAYAEGLRLFQWRKAAKFDTVGLPPQKRDRPLIAVCILGNSFSLPWVIRWTQLLQLGVSRFDMNLHFAGGVTNVYHARIGMAREVLAAEPCDYVLWLDDDQLVEQEHVLQLVEDLDQNPDVDMVAGWTVCGVDSYQTEPQISCGLVEGKLAFAADLKESESDLVPVLYTGFPLVLMRYSLLEALRPRAFWPFGDVEDSILPKGEDVSFCDFAQHAGKQIRVDRRVGPLPHLKLRDIAAGVPG